MKNFTLSKLIGAGVIATTLAVVPFTLPAQAQETAPGTSIEQDGEVENVETEDDFDWGWLGLLGLAGLAGLAGKKRPETVQTSHVSNDPDVQVRSGSDYR